MIEPKELKWGLYEWPRHRIAPSKPYWDKTAKFLVLESLNVVALTKRSMDLVAEPPPNLYYISWASMFHRNTWLDSLRDWVQLSLNDDNS